MRVVVIGSGVGGLATALRLAHSGHQVTVIEQGERVGGKLNIWQPDVPGVGRFKFDTGPHVLTMPWAFAELFEDVGERMADWIQLERIDPICRYHFADAPYFDAPASPARARAAVATRFPGDEDGFAALLRFASRVHDTTVDAFLRQDFANAIRGIPTPAQWRQLRGFLGLKPWRTLQYLTNTYLRNPRLRQIFALYALYNGSSPTRASCIYAIIAHEQWTDGTYYLRGGLRTLADAIETLCRRRGVEFRLGTTATRIEFATRASGRPEVCAVLTAGAEEPIPADAVVCNADPLTAYSRLVPKAYRPRHFRDADALAKLQPSTSAFLMLLGVKGRFEHLAHYNSFLPKDSEAEYAAVFDRNEFAANPVIGITCQSVTDSGCAPSNHSNLFIMTSPPALPVSGGNHWSIARTQTYRANLIHLLEARCGMTGLSGRIVCEQVWTPETFEARYGAWRGSLYGLSSNSASSGFLRPPNRAPGVRGLYFVGGGTHPGGGLPLVTLGAKIVADAVRDDARKTKK